MVVGVNGVGKTTTIGKLAYKFKKSGFKVVLGAADTFRAAAIDQLTIWADRVGVEIVKQNMGSDPASVAYDTLQSAISKNADVVIWSKNPFSVYALVEKVFIDGATAYDKESNFQPASDFDVGIISPNKNRIEE